MHTEPVVWFVGQVVAAGLAGVAGWRIARCEPRVWKRTALLATVLMLAWPFMRLFPAHVIRWLGANLVIFIEVTGIVIPAVLLFTIAARNTRTEGQRRAVRLLIPVCALYFIRYGVWMVRPPIADLGPTQLQGEVCRQSTTYTCVAASLVTLLKAYGYEAGETQMARLSYTEVDWGTSDSRAVLALQKRLAGEAVDVCYEVMDYERLKSVPKPCIVPIRWNYFVSHMVPVLSADENGVRIGDPLAGVLHESAKDFYRMWHKRGIYLVDRRPDAERSSP
jgi:predicted double-glycine peptidase